MGKSAPKAPDPMETASQQSRLNTDTALTNQMLNMVNQSGPFGSTTYNQTGSTQYTDSFGNVHTLPTYTQETSYSPEVQAIFDKALAAQGSVAQTAINSANNLSSSLSQPFSFTNQDAANWAYDLASQRILPQQQQAQSALESQLVNSGIRRGTAAWDREMMRMQQANNDQMNQLALTGREQAFNEQLAGRNQGINEVMALLGGSQVQSPTAGYVAAPQTSMAGVDYTGLVNQKYQADMANYQNQMGGLFGTLGTIATAGMNKLF